MTYRAGDAVEILPEFMDDGDEEFQWVVMSDEEKGRVDICPISHPMSIKPIYTLSVTQLRRTIYCNVTATVDSGSSQD